MSEQSGPRSARFEIQRVYLKDVSLECPNTPALFVNMQWKPQANLQVECEHTALDSSNYEVCVTVTLKLTIEEKTAYLVEVKQAGVFTLDNVQEDQLEPLLRIGCPNILFPFAREAVADLVQKAGFPPHLLPLVNFEALVAQERQRREEATAGAQHSDKHH